MLHIHRGYLLPALLAAVLLMLSPALYADDKAKIDSGTQEALEKLRSHSDKAGELVDKAVGVVTAGASFGLQVGAQVKSEVILFMTKEALSKFQNSSGWRVGVDGSVALIKLGGGGSIDTAKINQPVVGFIFSNKGLMYNLTMEGTKITRIAR